jgi:hypothetical protein
MIHSGVHFVIARIIFKDRTPISFNAVNTLAHQQVVRVVT